MFKYLKLLGGCFLTVLENPLMLFAFASSGALSLSQIGSENRLLKITSAYFWLIQSSHYEIKFFTHLPHSD
jgi:hypothetical protein